MTVPSVVLCNSGPLIALGKLNRLDLLTALYNRVEITQAVYTEVVLQGLMRGSPDAATVRHFWQQQGWPIITVSNDLMANYQPSVVLDRGEIEILTVAQSYANTLVLLDDEAARSEARHLNLQVKGTVGVIVDAYRNQALTFLQTEFLLQEIARRSDIWISARLCQQVLASLSATQQAE